MLFQDRWLLLAGLFVGTLLGLVWLPDGRGQDLARIYEQFNAYRKAGQIKEAEALGQKTLRELTAAGRSLPAAQWAHNLGILYVGANRFHDAEHYYQHALKIRRSDPGAKPLDTAFTLTNLGAVYYKLGQYDKAMAYHRESLQIREESLGKEHPQVAHSLNDLAVLSKIQGKYGEAEPLLLRSFKVREKVLGPDHPDVAQSASNLAVLYQEQGKYGEAEPLYLRSLKIREKVLGPEHPDVADSLNNLAVLYRIQGRYGEAEPLLQRSLTIREKVHGPDHPDVAQSLHNLATLFTNQRKYAEAEPRFLRSLKIEEKVRGPDHPDVAQSLNNLANLHKTQGKYAEAEPLYQRSFTILEKVHGPDHPNVALSLNNLALLYQDQGKSQEAMPLVDRMRRATRLFLLRELPYLPDAEQQKFFQVGETNRFHCALSLGLQRAGDPALVQRSAEWLLNGKAIGLEALSVRTRLEREAGAGQAAIVRQLQQLRAQETTLALSLFDLRTADKRRQSLEQLQAQRRQLEQQLAANSPSLKRFSRLWIGLQEVRQAIPRGSVLIDIARFWVYHPGAKGAEKEWDAPRYAAWVLPALGQGEGVLVDLGEAWAIETDIKAVRQLLAGSKKQIETVGEPQAEQQVSEALQRLARRVLHPLLPHLGQAQQLILSPDGALWLVPWNALPLPDGKYAIEKFLLSHVVSGRDLVQPPGQESKTSTALVLADPNFNLPVDEADKLSRALLGAQGLEDATLAGRQASGLLGQWQIHVEFAADGVFVLRDKDERGEVYGRGRWSLQGNSLRAETEKSLYQAQLQGQKLTGQRRLKDNSAPAETWTLTLDRPAEPLLVRNDSVRSAVRLDRAERLPYTAAEAERIAPALKNYTGTAPRVLTDNQALAAAVQVARHPRVLVLSTHGFFLPDQQIDPDAKKKSGRIENPLLRCGLLLAGCNNAEKAKEGQNTGVLTGLQIVGCDLRGTELVVLSACETGLGDVRNGEGVAGLRQAFQLAGAQSVAATLWQIPDQASALLMIDFWKNLAAGQSKPEALRNAQLSLIKSRRDRNAAAHPFFWAAFTLTGDPG